MNPGPEDFWMGFPVATASRPVFGSVNLCGLMSKIDDVRLRLSVHRLQVLAIQESHLNPRVNSDELPVNGYHLFRKDRTGANKGGVALFIADSLHPIAVCSRQLLSGVSELVVARANFRSRSVLFASIYLAPKNRYTADKFDEWLDNFSSWLASLGTGVSDVVLMGDLNLAPDEPNFARLQDMCSSFGLVSILNQPTHGGGNLRRRQIDYIFVGTPILGGKCHLAPPLEKSSSGHSFVLFSPISLHVPKHFQPATTIRLFKNTDLPKAQFKLLYSQNGEPRNFAAEIFAKATANEAAQHLTRQISVAFCESTPVTRIPANSRPAPVDPKIRCLLHQRHSAYAAWKRGMRPRDL